jgi:hypothetical protein
MDDEGSGSQDIAQPSRAGVGRSPIRNIELGDLATNRIIYAVTLLGVLLTANSLLTHLGHIGFTFSQRRWLLTPPITWHVHAVLFIYVMEALLALAVYIWGFDFLLRLRLFHLTGLYLFGTALAIPPFYILCVGYANLVDLSLRLHGAAYYVIVTIGLVIFWVVAVVVEVAVVSRLVATDSAGN